MKPSVTPKKQFLVFANFTFKNALGLIGLKSYPNSYPPKNEHYHAVDTLKFTVSSN